jgi:hypothetical protein
MKEAVQISETVIHSLHGATTQKTAIFLNYPSFIKEFGIIFTALRAGVAQSVQ